MTLYECGDFLKKKAFPMITTFFNLSYVNSLECISMNNQECKARPKTINVNKDEPVFYPYSIKVNKCSGSCSNIMIHMLNCVFQISLKT